jgi:hypothetical protein
MPDSFDATTFRKPVQGPTDPHTDPTAPARAWPWVSPSGVVLVQGLIFGTIFGFLLQKAGVANFDILIGVLLLENFVVLKTMLSAIVVGMVGVYLLKRFGVLEGQVKNTGWGANVIGGLLFGIGFALLAYCPGTTAAAAGQGNYDALVGMVGLALGSYLYALTSGWTGRTVSTWGRRGQLTLPGLVGLSEGVFILIAVPLLIGVLLLLEFVFGG